MFEKSTTALDGVFVLTPRIFHDHRGTFVKVFHDDAFREMGLDFHLREQFFSISHKNVVRGMHFQMPPDDHAKIVHCPVGAVLDVVLDLRRSSPTFGRSVSFELSAENRRLAFIPSGFAHGFLSLTEGAIMVYKTTTVHSQVCDAGIRWDSFGFDWPIQNPILSERDAKFPGLGEFRSPFE